MSKRIISICPGGLCNRLKCLISCLRISDKYNRELAINWPKNWACGAEFNELFDNHIKSISIDELEKIEREKNYFFYTDRNNLILPNREKEVITDTWRFCLFEEEVSSGFSREVPPKFGESIDFEYDRIPKKVKRKILSEINKIKIKKEILKIVEDFSKKNNVSESIGLHIRRGDIVNSKDGWGKISDEEKFIGKIKQILISSPNQTFFLATDSTETEKIVKEMFGKNIVTYSKKVVKRDSPASVIESLIELLILAKTKKIIGTYQSTYTELAWWFGGANKEIQILASEEDKKKLMKNRQKIEQSLKTKLKKTILSVLKKYPRFYRKSYSLREIWLN